MSTTAIRAITTAVLILFVGAMGPAFAGSATIGVVSINLPTPKGFCELSSNDSSEKIYAHNYRSNSKERRQYTVEYECGLPTACSLGCTSAQSY